MKDDDRLLGAALCGLAALVVGVLLGVVLWPVRTTIGLENVVVLYVAVVAIAAARAGQLAGSLTAAVSALAYNYFFATPYETLKIDSLEQFVTVLLLFGAGIGTSVAIGVHDRASQQNHDRALARQGRPLDAVAAVLEAEAAGYHVAESAVHQVKELLDARWVALLAHGSAVPLAYDGQIPPGVSLHELQPVDLEGGSAHAAEAEVFRVPVRHAGVADGSLVVLLPQSRTVTPGELTAVTGIARAVAVTGVRAARR